MSDPLGQISTTAELLELMKSVTEGNNVKKDPSLYRYALYARKSTHGDERQEKSLADQVTECEAFIEKNNLKVVKPYILEKESAKTSGIRPKFAKLLQDIKAGKYDGIIAWHPDRLSRNMKEAGEIIDLLDREEIKDLRFVSFSFENSVTGKVLLGIAFVLSKQYSDQLSKNVKRGNQHRVMEGKWLNRPKHGYYKDRNQYLRPDADNFFLIKEAWAMRSQKKTYEEISEYLNSHGFSKPITGYSDKYEVYNMDKKRLSEMFKDPVYAGVMRHGEQVVDLTSIYDFEPVVSVNTFMQINKTMDLDKFLRRSDHRSVKRGVKGKLLNSKVICGHCGQPMHVSITSPKKNNIFYYRCDTKNCFISNKSGSKVKHHVRAKVIVNFVYDFLDTHIFDTREAFEHYQKEIKKVQKTKLAQITTEINSAKQELRRLNNQIKLIKKHLTEEEDQDIKDEYRNDLKTNLAKKDEVEDAIKKANKLLNKHKTSFLSYAEFTEQMRKLPDMIKKTKSIEKKDYLIQKIFSNLSVENKKVATYQLEEPFATFMKKGFVSKCRGDRTRTCDLTVPNRAL